MSILIFKRSILVMTIFFIKKAMLMLAVKENFLQKGFSLSTASSMHSLKLEGIWLWKKNLIRSASPQLVQHCFNPKPG